MSYPSRFFSYYTDLLQPGKLIGMFSVFVFRNDISVETLFICSVPFHHNKQDYRQVY